MGVRRELCPGGPEECQLCLDWAGEEGSQSRGVLRIWKDKGDWRRAFVAEGIAPAKP